MLRSCEVARWTLGLGSMLATGGRLLMMESVGDGGLGELERLLQIRVVGIIGEF
jgi:hypothetical protein